MLKQDKIMLHKFLWLQPGCIWLRQTVSVSCCNREVHSSLAYAYILNRNVFILTRPMCMIFWMIIRMEAGSALWRVVLDFRSFKNLTLWAAQPLQLSVSPTGWIRAEITHQPNKHLKLTVGSGLCSNESRCSSTCAWCNLSNSARRLFRDISYGLHGQLVPCVQWRCHWWLYLQPSGRTGSEPSAALQRLVTRAYSKRTVCHINKSTTQCHVNTRINSTQEHQKLTPHVTQIICVALCHFVNGAQRSLCPAYEVICSGRPNRRLKKHVQVLHVVIQLTSRSLQHFI